MRHKGPIITLLAGLLVAGVLFALNVNLSNDAARDADAKNAAANATAPTSAPPAAAGGEKSSPGPSKAAAPSKAPPSKAPEGKSTYAGETDEGSAGLAIAGNGGKAVAYVCDGKAAEAWMSGEMTAGKIQLRSAKGTSTLTGTYGNGVAQGIVTVGKKTWHFKIELATPPSGAYRSAAGVRNRLDSSWVQTKNKQFGVKRVGDALSPAPPLDTATSTATVDGAPVAVELADPDKSNW